VPPSKLLLFKPLGSPRCSLNLPRDYAPDLPPPVPDTCCSTFWLICQTVKWHCLINVTTFSAPCDPPILSSDSSSVVRQPRIRRVYGLRANPFCMRVPPPHRDAKDVAVLFSYRHIIKLILTLSLTSLTRGENPFSPPIRPQIDYFFLSFFTQYCSAI